MTKPGFSPNKIAGEVRCNGIHHNDYAIQGTCNGCGAEVAKRDDGRIYPVVHYTTEGGYERTAIRCYNPTHKCDPERAALYEAAQAEALASGKIVKGQKVVVVRGRKVKKGTEGVVFWMAQDEDYVGNEYTRIGIKDADGTAHWLNADYVKAI